MGPPPDLAYAADVPPTAMKPSRETRQLRDAILAEARARGVPLEAESLTIEVGLPVLRVRLGERVLRGVSVRLPGAWRSDEPDVITVQGSAFRSSRMWPRRLDGSFRIEAVVDHLLALARDEIDRPRPVPHVAGGVPVAASGLHVMHAAAVVLGVLSSETSPQDLVARVSGERQRAKIQARIVSGGLTDSDLRALGDSTGMFFGRSMKTDDVDPFEPISPGILTVLRLGDERGGEVTRRFVLLLDRRGDRVTIADPSGPGVVSIARRTLDAAWRLGATGSGPYFGALSRRARDLGRIDGPGD